MPMPRKASGNFNQAKYNQQWAKENMKTLNMRYKTEFVDEFREACKKLGVKQSDVVRQAMIQTIEEAKNTEDTQNQ